jgi:hypothetical protein
MLHLEGVLVRFEVVSGLHINIGKSKIVPVGSVPAVCELAQILGGRISLSLSLSLSGSSFSAL